MEYIKIKKKFFIILISIFVISIIFNVFLCALFLFSSHNNWSLKYSKELIRITSPDSLVDAVLMENYGGGATVGFSYHIYIVKSGEKPEGRDEVLLANHIDSLYIIWRQNYFLEIHYKTAHILYFNNLWFSSSFGDRYYNVEIRLEPSSNSWSLSEKDRFRYPIIGK